MKKTIKVVTVINGEPKLCEIKNELKELQSIVGGYIEIPFISEKLQNMGIDIIINEEGKLMGLTPSFAVMKGEQLIDLICGNVIFTSHDENGNQKSLTKEQFLYVTELVNKRVILGNEKENMCDCGIINF